MAKCSLCGNEMRFGQQSFILSTLDGKICSKCQQELTKKKTQSKGCDIEYLKSLESTASTSRNKAYIQELLAIPEDPEPEDISDSDDNSDSEYCSMLETTGVNFEGYSIVKYNGVVFSESVLGTGAFSELSASFSDLLGTKSNAFMRKLSQAREHAMLELKKNAYHVGANAIIGISLEYTTFASNLIGIAARGTAVTIEKNSFE